ncbi:CRISPR-associated helicase Cas3' [Aggregatilineales bacterium SYSU G02658]
MNQAEAFEIAFEILKLVRQSENGLTTSEIGKSLGITRQTALKYIQHLIKVGFNLYESDRRWHYDKQSSVLQHFSKSEQALLQIMLERYQWVGTTDTAFYSTLLSLAAKFDIPLSQSFTSSNRIFEVLVNAYFEKRIVEVLYHGMRAQKPTRWHIKPIKFTMPVWSDAVYLLGTGYQPPSQSDTYLTLKLNRILQAQPLQKFDEREHCDWLKRQQAAWLVWQSNQPSTEVILHFAGHLYRRLQESRWHASQTLEVVQDGRVRVTFHIAEPQEILPWVRSWGADVEIVAPEALREAHKRELARALDRYYRDTIDVGIHPLAVRFWAKYNPQTYDYHVLDAHLLDVAAVAWAFWDHFPAVQQEWISQQLSLSKDQTQRWLSFLAGAHDVGKASPGFQRKAEGWQTSLERAGFRFVFPMAEPHGAVTTLSLKKYLRNKGMQKAQASSLATAVGSHHGRWVDDQQIDELDEKWQHVEFDLLDMLWEATGIQALPNLGRPALIAGWIAGFVSVADWIGSQDKYFPYCPSVEDHQTYFEMQCEKASQVLSILGFYTLETAVVPQKFLDLFGFAPNSMQQTVIEAAASPHDLKTVVIEAPTGDGKTEAALYVAYQLLNQFSNAGFYIAMPTRATSNQLFERTYHFLSKAFPNQGLNYYLIHSQAVDHQLYQQLLMSTSTGNEDSLVAAEWFQPRKRSLLAQFGVGTVDQAMLAALMTKHFFVYLFALSCKIVIVDEVHAYDTYMSTVQDRLLQWLDAMESPVILLSATLPSTSRQRLLGTDKPILDDTPYPRMTLRYRDGTIRVVPLTTQRQRTIHLHWIPSDDDTLLSELSRRLEQGGCAAVICNTVAEAQQLYETALRHPSFNPEDVMLFHARFPAPWRDEIEKRVIGEFGKDGIRPHKRLLIATQIIEQSLDLDFDIISSFVAPVDLLIQRFGRLHRHNRVRPEPLQTPTVLLREPLLVDEKIDFGLSEYIYDRYVLLQTYAHLRPMTQISVPQDVESLIETVYDPAPVWPEWIHQEAKTAHEALKNQRDKQQYVAKINLISKPTDNFLSITVYDDTSTDDEEAGKPSSVTTRLAAPSVRIICLHQFGSVLSFDPDELIPCHLDNRPDAALIREMMRYSVVVQSRRVRKVLMQQEQKAEIAHVAQLHNARIVTFEQGIAHIGDGLRLRLTKELGLVIEGDIE